MAFSPETYALCLKNTAEKIDEALTSVYNYKGSVDTIADLPLTNNKVGDTYDVKSEGGQNYGWNGESWDSLGVNREATDTDLGLIKKKDNTFNTTTFVGDMTAINSDNTSITGSGITSINGEGNFEVSKPTTILASKTNNIAGEVVTISPSSRINLTTAGINLVTAGPDRMGITINANDMPLTLQGKVVIDGYDTTYINTPVIISKDMEASSLTAHESIYTKKIYSNNIYGQNFGSNADGASSLITHTGAKNNIVLGADNTYLGPDPGSTVLNTENIIIGRSNRIAPVAANNFIIGRSNEMYANYSTILGFSNHINKDYSLAKGQENEVNALGATVFGSKNNAIYSAEFGLVSGFRNTLNGKVSTVLGDNLNGSTETGSMTIGTFNEKKDAMFVVGNGNQSSSDVITRSNAFEVYKNGDAVIQNNLTVGGTINSSSLKNIPVWTLDDIQESDELVNIFKYFLGDGYNDFTTCNRWFIVMPQSPHQFFIGHESKQGVTLNLSSLGEMHLLYFIKASEKWTITLYNITGKLNESSTKSIPTIEVRSFVEDESGNFSALTTIPTFVTSVSGMMDADYNPSSDRHIITMKYLNTRIQELLDNEISSKITEELNKINVAENKN
jgi:DNA/RNA endonuclease YhcR with UshA esterase domain